MRGESGTQFVSGGDGILANVQIEVIREQGTKLDTEQTALGQQSPVLLDDGKEMRDQRSIGNDDGLAKQGAAFRAANIENVGQARQVRQGDIVSGAGEGVGQAGTVDVERQVVAVADLADGRELGQRVQRAIFGRLRDIDHAGHDHVLAVAIVQVVFTVGSDGRSADFAKMMGERQHLVAAELNRPGLMYADMPAVCGDYSLVGAQQGVDDGGIRLRAAQQEIYGGQWAGAGCTDFFPGLIRE